MEYVQAKRLLEQALENQKTIKIDKLKEIMDVIKAHKKSELQYYKDKSINLERRLKQMKRQSESVIVVKTKHGIPSVIQLYGVRYTRDSSYKVFNGKVIKGGE
ncbi:hypothetical protein [Ureibacillus sinduriensis]|uniref:Uncharacterized protein n=1 Tax=Ureibacillus sinduriensis BLB-1 = JCM 15800 TaxID=1384057 RepID=A0A0A3HX00_9BACL|nr:hypothetical protein [Ureibacillus sinduriensis]KGR74878.1 hypothetical protein CD33_14040 [Ureibacillus sinduriensis BLB-1 = JCM 15800]